MSVEFQPQPSNVRPGHREPHAHAGDQPFAYPLEREFVEPDWTRAARLPGRHRRSSGSPPSGSAPTR